MQTADKFCQSLAALNDKIETVMLLEDDQIVAYYSKNPEQLRFLAHSTAAMKGIILRMQIFTSIMNEDNMIQSAHGGLRYAKVSRDRADLFFFSLEVMKTLIVTTKGEYNESSLVDTIMNNI